MNFKSSIHWALRIIPAAILLQTLYFKFGGHEDSIALFSTLGIEPWGRIGTGFIELLASILLLIPKLTRFGALLSVGTMSGAITSHLLILGIEFNNDGGALFALAVIVAICSLILLYVEKNTLLLDYKGIFGKA